MLGAFRACPAPRLWLLKGRDARSPSAPRFCPNSLGDADAQKRALQSPPRWRLSIRSQQVATLPWFRAGGRYSVPLFAVQSRHEEPYPPMSKINRPPFRVRYESVYPIPPPISSGKCVFWKLWVGYFERWSRLCAAKMAALHAAVAGRASFHRSQQAATLPLAATSAAVPAAARRGRLTLPQRARRPLSQ